jgi:hypothetical protein
MDWLLDFAVIAVLVFAGFLIGLNTVEVNTYYCYYDHSRFVIGDIDPVCSQFERSYTLFRDVEPYILYYNMSVEG